jgi:hypothetical protein
MSSSRTGVVALVVIVAAVCLALLLLPVIYGPRLPLERSITASLLILCSAIFVVGGMLFTARAFWKWPAAQTQRYLRWERSFIIAAVVATALGLALLQGLLRDAGDSVFGTMGTVGYLLGAVVVVVAETSALDGREWPTVQITFYVVIAFLAQAILGVALLRTGLVAGWAGWTAIIWNLGWLIIFAVLRPRDIYYPVLHHVAPLIIGIALLAQ